MEANDLYKIGYKVSDNAHEQIWAHMGSLYNLSTIVEWVNDEMIDDEFQPQICVSKKEEAGIYGNVGLFLKGTVVAMFRHDIDSSISSVDGMSREFPDRYIKSLISDFDNLKADYSGYEYTTKHMWTESFLIPQEVIGVWIKKEKASEEMLASLRKRFKSLSITII